MPENRAPPATRTESPHKARDTSQDQSAAESPAKSVAESPVKSLDESLAESLAESLDESPAQFPAKSEVDARADPEAEVRRHGSVSARAARPAPQAASHMAEYRAEYRAEYMAEYMAELNPEQRMAVEAVDGPVLVLAGAGTGKTRVLTTRIAHILRLGRARGAEILAVTFTNKAAREMKERIGALLGGAVEGMPWLGTFHAIGVKILRRHAELVGLKSGFTILDTDDQVRLIAQVLESEGLDKNRWPARRLASLIDHWKNRGLTPDKVPRGEAFAFAEGAGARLYGVYQRRLKELNAADFGDLLLEVLRLFGENPDVLALYRRRFRFTLVDEYQDTNVAQYLWLRLIAGGSPNICCVGDDDQSIYGWRGAEVDNILRFENDFPGARIIRLERNYRSKGHILAAASGLIAHNKGRLGKRLFTDDDAGDPVVVAGMWDDEEEARTIGRDIEALAQAGQALNGIAILVRASFQMRAFEDRFISLGLPYRGDRRSALLRTPGDQGRHRLPGGRLQPGQRSEVRADPQCAKARARRDRLAPHQPAGARPEGLALSRGARDRRDRGTREQGAQVARRPAFRLRALARQGRTGEAHGARRVDPR